MKEARFHRSSTRMDRLESLGQITMYYVRSMYNQVGFFSLAKANPLTFAPCECFQAKNVVLNVSEIKAKVREAI